MKHALMIGSNMYIGTNGILNVEIEGKIKEFFKVREISKKRSEGSYLAIDCDIKDSENQREIKIFKNNPVVVNENIQIENNKTVLIAKRNDGEVIIKIEQLSSDDISLPKTGPIPKLLKENPVDSILRITGTFYAGPYKLVIDNEKLNVGGLTMSGNLSIGTGGLTLTQMGFSM